MTRIGNHAIESTELETLVIPDNVREIGIQAIIDNPNLKTVVIGSGVEETGIMALDENQSLEAIYLRRETPAEIQEDLFEDEYYDKVTLYVPTGIKEAYAIKTECAGEQVYGVDGSRRATLRRGLNILRSKGETRKVIFPY